KENSHGQESITSSDHIIITIRCRHSCHIRSNNPDAVSQSWNEVTMTMTPEMTTDSPSTIKIELKGMKDISQPQNEESQLTLPPPPGMPHLRGAISYHNRTDSPASQRKVSLSMSIRAQGGGEIYRRSCRRIWKPLRRCGSLTISTIFSDPAEALVEEEDHRRQWVFRRERERHQRRTEEDHRRQRGSAAVAVAICAGGGELSPKEDPTNKRQDKNLIHEDSIWKKTIILGERCRVLDEDDTILYDENGNRISAYHPKTPSSLALSRQTSSIDPEAIPSSGAQK
ncbi:hypothetical protein HYC85_022672, partial [Camellia sinensis]